MKTFTEICESFFYEDALDILYPDVVGAAIEEAKLEIVLIDAADVIFFKNDGTFELYQKMSSEGFELRRGTWTLDGDILSGAYNDGEAWAASYKVSAGSTLTLVSQAEGGETNVYIPCAIPEEIKRNCTIVVRSR